MLRSIHISSHVLDQQAPWLCRIHSLVLDHMYSIQRHLQYSLLHIALRELKIVDIRDDSINSPLPTVFLPRLKVLEYPGLSISGVALLEQIMVPGIVRWSFGSAISSIVQISYIKNRTFFPLSAHSSDTSSVPCNQMSTISLTLLMKTGASPAYAQLLIQSLVFSTFQCICVATLTVMFSKRFKEAALTRIHQCYKLRFIANRRLNPFFALFFSCLTSVKIMTTDLRTLSQLAYLQNRFIMKATKQSQIIFPMLAVINLTNNYWAWYPVSSINQVAATFFLLRSQEGYPITKLYMTNLHPFDAPPDLHTLSAVKGLNVFYRLETFQGIVEYTYGKFGEMYQYHSSYVPTF